METENTQIKFRTLEDNKISSSVPPSTVIENDSIHWISTFSMSKDK